VLVVPVRDHFFATADPGRVPLLSSGASLAAMQIEYWRTRLSVINYDLASEPMRRRSPEQFDQDWHYFSRRPRRTG
jgi:hypothetical protein